MSLHTLSLRAALISILELGVLSALYVAAGSICHILCTDSNAEEYARPALALSRGRCDQGAGLALWAAYGALMRRKLIR